MTRWQRRFELDDDKYPELYQFTEDLKSSRGFAPFMIDLLNIGYSIRQKNDPVPLIESEHLRDNDNGGIVLNDIHQGLVLLDMVERADIEALFSTYPELMMETIRFMRGSSGDPASIPQQPAPHTPKAQKPQAKAAFKSVDVSLDEEELLQNTFNALDDLFGD